jgi:hypothetical protein
MAVVLKLEDVSKFSGLEILCGVSLEIRQATPRHHQSQRSRQDHSLSCHHRFLPAQ